MRRVALWTRDPGNSRGSAVALLKKLRLVAAPVQVGQDVEAHHDVLQQLLYLLIRVLHRRSWSCFKATGLVWGQAFTTGWLGVRGGAEVGW